MVAPCGDLLHSGVSVVPQLLSVGSALKFFALITGGAYLQTWLWPDDEAGCCFFLVPAPLVDGSAALVALGLLLPLFRGRLCFSPSGDGREELVAADSSRPLDRGREGKAVRGCDAVATGCEASVMVISN